MVCGCDCYECHRLQPGAVLNRKKEMEYRYPSDLPQPYRQYKQNPQQNQTARNYEMQITLRCVSRARWWRYQNLMLWMETAGYLLVTGLAFLLYGGCCSRRSADDLERGLSCTFRRCLRHLIIGECMDSAAWITDRMVSRLKQLMAMTA